MDRKPSPDPVYVLRGTIGSVNALKFVPKPISNDEMLVSGSSNGIISLWNLKTKRVQSSIDNHHGKAVIELGLTNKPNLISHGRDGKIFIWDISSSEPRLLSQMEGPVLGFCKFSILDDDKVQWLATAYQSEVVINDLKTSKVAHRLKPQDHMSFGMCMCMKMFCCSQTSHPMILCGYENGKVALWDISMCRMMSHLASHSESVMCLNVDEVNHKAVTGSADNKLSITTFGLDGQLSSTGEVQLKTEGVASVKVRCDSRILASGAWDGRVRVHSWKSLKPLAVLNYHCATVNTVEFSSESSAGRMLMAAGSKDSRISLWDIYN
ncbi:predicted protein [Nematostella vectensis]|uniref:Guanine nucleotide-binding protein subunit beta-like protein 1 n=1 Tax=Nematostella vectensis TaxID=45351 RepID=A7RV82_NEMVE|nr:predicted protein [Nematostella vectensis]|eukprot:XP_001636589.1 predicted protein [Nematostella vectensis]